MKNKGLPQGYTRNLMSRILISSLKTANCVEIMEELRRYKIIFTNES